MILISAIVVFAAVVVGYLVFCFFYDLIRPKPIQHVQRVELETETSRRLRQAFVILAQASAAGELHEKSQAEAQELLDELFSGAKREPDPDLYQRVVNLFKQIHGEENVVGLLVPSRKRQLDAWLGIPSTKRR